MEKGVMSCDSHRLVGEQIKDYLHTVGIHSTTVQIEYLRAGLAGTQGGCELECPPCEVTGLKDPQCSLYSCCQKETSNGSAGLLNDGTIEIFSKL